MGLPIDRLIVATNQNDILHRCLTTGDYRMDDVVPSISPSMDIQISSNFERALFYAYAGDGAAVAALMDDLKTKGGFAVSQGILDTLRKDFDSGRVSEDETSAEITVLPNACGIAVSAFCHRGACRRSDAGSKHTNDYIGDGPSRQIP